MKQWYANNLSKLTRVSVRTLHYYDKIGLLKPSLRLSNGYRLYSEADLLKLQQIIALKFLGFELSQIKTLLVTDVNIVEHFSMQAQFLQKKAEALVEASSILRRITADCSDKKSIPWEKTIQLIEVYRMTQELENSWLKKILNQEELKQYAAFVQGLKSSHNLHDKAKFEKDWAILVTDVKKNINNDPASEIGVDIGKRCMIMINELYGKEHLNLRTKIWEEGYKKNQMPEGEHALSPQIVAWLDKAADAYWRQRIYNILSQVGKNSPSKVLALWNEVLEEMYGSEEEPKNAVIAAALADDKVSQEAKNWLKQVKQR